MTTAALIVLAVTAVVLGVALIDAVTAHVRAARTRRARLAAEIARITSDARP